MKIERYYPINTLYAYFSGRNIQIHAVNSETKKSLCGRGVEGWFKADPAMPITCRKCTISMRKTLREVVENGNGASAERHKQDKATQS